MPVLQATGVKKRYGETQALDGLDLVLRPDEVTGIAGPNGAGKSTLVRIIGGEETADEGEIRLGDASWRDLSPREVVAVVHQEPKLFPQLTVAENLLVGSPHRGIRRPAPTRADRAFLAEFGIEHFADRPLEGCSLVTWQLTEIARAVRRDAQVFLFDEPNSALSDDESERLFKHILELRQRGHIVVLVSHRLPELADLCDRVIIVREGTAAVSLAGTDLTADAIAGELVVGHKSTTPSGPRATQDSGAHSGGATAEREAGSARSTVQLDTEERPILLALRGWSHAGGAFRDVALDVRRGEVLAVMGVEGSGGRELIRSIAGLEPATGDMQMAPTHSAARTEVSYLPADRRTSLFPNFSVGANLISRLGAPEIASTRGRLKRTQYRAVAVDLMRAYRIKARSHSQAIGALSGGNQQKVAVAGAAATSPQLLLIEEPTRGVDVGTKAEIYRLLWDFASEGNAVVTFCTEVPEVFDLAEQVRVSHLGKLSAPLYVNDFTDVTGLAEAVAQASREQEMAAS